MTASPKVSIIIPTLHLSRPRNTRFLVFQKYTLMQVLADLASNVSIPIEIVIVCNGQDPALVEVVKSNAAVSKYCLNSVNVGVSRAWNMGAMMAEGETLCFLNDDVQVGRGVIEALYETLMSDPTIGQVGPKGNTMIGSSHKEFVGLDAPEDADMISGFCFMVRAATFARVGGFDISYTPAGYEETDFSFGIRKLGLRCRVVPGLDIKHFDRHGVSASRGSVSYLDKTITTQDLHVRNKAYFENKWLG